MSGNPGSDVIIQSLIDENKALLATLEQAKDGHARECQDIKKEAASLIDRLLRDNAWFRKANTELTRDREAQTASEESFAVKFRASQKREQDLSRQLRALERCVGTLREQKATLEYQVKHLGAAALALREEALSFVGSPLRFETQRRDISWETHAPTPEFRDAVMQTVARLMKLQTIVEAVDSRLVALRILDPASAVSAVSAARGKTKPTTTYLMGERLVPERELDQVRKERQLWQRRFMKQTEAAAKSKAEVDRLVDELAKTAQRCSVLQAEAGTHRKAAAVRSKSSTDTLQRALDDVRKELELSRDTVARLEREKVDAERQARSRERSQREGNATAAAAAPVLSQAKSRYFLGDASPGGGEEAPPRPMQSRRLRSPSRLALAALGGAGEASRPGPSASQKDAAESAGASGGSAASSLFTLAIPSFLGGGGGGAGPADAASADASAAAGGAQASQHSESSRPLDRTVSSASFGGRKPSPEGRRRISTMLSHSEWDTPLAREIAALEKQETGQAARPSPPQGRRPSIAASREFLEVDESREGGGGRRTGGGGAARPTATSTSSAQEGGGSAASRLGTGDAGALSRAAASRDFLGGPPSGGGGGRAAPAAAALGPPPQRAGSRASTSGDAALLPSGSGIRLGSFRGGAGAGGRGAGGAEEFPPPAPPTAPARAASRRVRSPAALRSTGGESGASSAAGGASSDAGGASSDAGGRVATGGGTATGGATGGAAAGGGGTAGSGAGSGPSDGSVAGATAAGAAAAAGFLSAPAHRASPPASVGRLARPPLKSAASLVEEVLHDSSGTGVTAAHLRRVLDALKFEDATGRKSAEAENT